jgi:chemotaxis protein methyltransferase CheR
MANFQPSELSGGNRIVDFPLSRREFSKIAGLLHRETGISLADTKLDLVQGRLARRIRALGLGSFAQYIAVLDGPEGASEQPWMINALTTNLTGFFREKHHFDFLADTILPALTQRRNGGSGRLRIWSAGCSSGEEPYSIAMTVASRLADLRKWDARILATDVDSDMVAFGRTGVYDATRISPIPDNLRRRFLSPVDGSDAMEATDSLRSLIAFRQLNLLQTWPMRGLFDVIFCRNVVIYFDKDTQRKLFDRYADILVPGGWLFIGHSESLFRISDRYDHLGRTIYRTRS